MHELSETPQERSCEEAHGRARGKHSAWSSNQQPSLTQPMAKRIQLLAGSFTFS
ncbi:hypothetical protein [Neobacillus niacini]|uniref:hypothetical protein n=1 Tax=Neobacillus niacini TaxID=86668 RepID=UPI00204046B7|nr:hypothetical protein [Neobacillus niacini]MCM3690677.1 hypothetical protein [Neobacillus niacini]